MLKLKVTIEEDHTVHVEGGIALAYTNMDLPPADALALLQELEKNRAQITDYATNFYDCPECSYTHHKSVRVCPNLEEGTDDE